MDSDDNYKLFDGLDPLEALTNENVINLSGDKNQYTHNENNDDDTDDTVNNFGLKVMDESVNNDDEDVLIVDYNNKKNEFDNDNNNKKFVNDKETLNIKLEFNDFVLEDNCCLDNNGILINEKLFNKSSKGRAFKCLIDNCNRTFFHNATFKMHQKLHEKNELKCKYCSKVLSDSNRLKLHQDNHKNKKGILKKYDCLVTGCNETFVSYSLLRNHELTHDLKSKPYHCEDCPKTFSSKHSYAKHLHIHKNIRPHSCLECGKCFIFLADLNTHRAMHRSVRKYNCDRCGYEFYKLSNLRRHEKVHESKKYYCEVCFVNFNYLSSLTKHMIKTHVIARNKQLIAENTETRKE